MQGQGGAKARGESRQSLREWAIAVAVAGLAMLVAWLAEAQLGLDDLSLIFITAVVLVASLTGKRIAVFAALLCLLGYNFLFTQPRHTFYVDSPHDLLTLGLFLLVALVCGHLASRLRQQVVALQAANATAAALQTLSQRLAAAADVEAVLQAGAASVHQALGVPVVIVPTENGAPRADAAVAHPRPVERDVVEGLVSACLQGGDEDPSSPNGWSCVALRHQEQILGVIALAEGRSGRQGDATSIALARGMAGQIAQALARVRLVGALESARVQGETERLRAALLASVSHDLRSPLSSIIGSAESLSTLHAQLPEHERIELAEGILQEGRRLDRYIQNLLDMTRLGHGSLTLDRDWVGLDEIVASAGARLARLFPELPLQVAIPPELPLLWVHPALIEQALFNILENAARFSPPGEAVRLRAELDGRTLRIDVIDAGPGIPEHERQRIFDMFYSVERGDRGGQGTGLGLTICQGMIGAHGGSVEALPGEAGRGTTIRITLPLIEPPPANEAA